MGRKSKHRDGSLQFWPRKRSSKFLPSVNWDVLNGEKGIKGFIAYKVGMTSCLVKDTTSNSLTKDKKIVLAASVLEVPAMKIFSIRFYKNGIVSKEIISENLDKELKRVIRIPKKKSENIDSIKDYDDIRIIAYSKVGETGIKKTPDMTEIGLQGSLDEKLKFVKEHMSKEIKFSEIFKPGILVDIRGLTTGKGLESSIKRFGLGLKGHKSEKGQRRPGSLGPWHPAHVIFRVPMAGQLGMFTRIQYNSKIVCIGKIAEKNINPENGWNAYGKIKTEYIIVPGSVHGTAKRQLLLTSPLRATKTRIKKQYEFVKLGDLR
ncbi:50S ribosomal protein L3 [Candidatus Pacearchaeota archaeon]|nr:50S ribosomal protein L3 [Candidatus Pacearchaeota archaeon]